MGTAAAGARRSARGAGRAGDPADERVIADRHLPIAGHDRDLPVTWIADPGHDRMGMVMVAVLVGLGLGGTDRSGRRQHGGCPGRGPDEATPGDVIHGAPPDLGFAAWRVEWLSGASARSRRSRLSAPGTGLSQNRITSSPKLLKLNRGRPPLDRGARGPAAPQAASAAR